ncbi:hypothetical protein [Marinobacter profundi]|uniref:Uncharacterized protein n=1 Tax=Marinobacter profundi TaxID=2666256 RepID=A0A2G1UKJ9_9GAMM|nr:hypothetical protein [Marinobacter profundi]PHQ14998.1 hypothetical protein CLH61_11725 [Marinobacter profundi]
MTDNHHYHAILAQGSAVPTLLCGHCQSTLSRSRVFRNAGQWDIAPGCDTIGLCSADDCGAVNCCDEALGKLENPDRFLQVAS